WGAIDKVNNILDLTNQIPHFFTVHQDVISAKYHFPRLQIPPNLSISHPSHPLQKPSERDTLPQVSRKSPQKQNQKDTQTPTKATKRNQTAQIGINPKIRYKTRNSPQSSPLFFPLPILQNARKSLLVT
ncbi:hypothetical protein, partial [Bacteroides mediterraneensis]|uniref:hypothetical protein n=1 Tax=Bacteroides mediterraneensis TaxID=1841856 RepID=UPI0026EFD55F